MADATFPLEIGAKGQRVRDAQWLLNGHNVFEEDTLGAKTKKGHHETGQIDGSYGKQTAEATKKMKHLLGYADNANDKFGEELRAYLLGDKKLPEQYAKRRADRVKKKIENERKQAAVQAKKPIRHYYPLGKRGPYIGYPGQGTHSFVLPPNNWESDNAVDISIPVGTPVIAYADGVIGPQFGPLDSTNPRFAGIRLHLVTAGNELYYAHLSATKPGLGPGTRLKAGDRIGKSGSANGAPHLHLGFQNGHPTDLLRGLPLSKK